MELALIAFMAFLTENVVLYRFMGICPFLGVSKKKSSAIGMGLAVIFVIVLSSIVTWLLYHYVLKPLDLVYLRIIVFILVIASLVQIVEMFIKKFTPSLYRALGIYLPLITTNCAVLGVATLVINYDYNFIQMLIFSLFSGLGFLFVMFIFSSLREKINEYNVPEGFRGIPIALITAAAMAIIFARLGGII
ncbi:MAG: RnfABCDGE type electron transport complex subunit A [Bacilli bacterium]|nr:RnfABCDGE type electron transport complex subunit A [Bacilli bacterium]